MLNLPPLRLPGAAAWSAVIAPLLASAALLSATPVLYQGEHVLDDPRGPGNPGIWYWEDMHLATAYALFDQFPAYTGWRIQSPPDPEPPSFNDDLYQLSRKRAIAPWQFWRTLGPQSFRRRPELTVLGHFNDAGRPLLLGLAFRALGGIAPFLMFWLGGLLAVPLLFWLSAELKMAGHAVAGAVLVLLLGTSAYVADLLALSYSAAGFYFLTAMLLAIVGAYACLGVDRSFAGLFVRWLIAGLLFAVFTLCRSGGLLLLPGFLLAGAVASARVAGRAHGAASWARCPLVLAAVVLLFLAPCLVTRMWLGRLVARTVASHEVPSIPQRHPVWYSVWTGLGDFDRSKGHIWDDRAAARVIERHGGVPPTATVYAPVNETILRDLFLAHVREEPLWYVTILVRRTLTTLTQWKLWHWPPRSGRSFRPRTHPNEGKIDAYYALTATADHFAVGPLRFELPLLVLLVPALSLPWLLRPASAARAALGWLTCLSAGLLVLPVLLTTAGALETQAFMLTYFAGDALAIEALLRRRRLIVSP
jgi:hypothetical protein